MQQLEADLNFIRSLPARPAMRTEDLQAEFDKAGNTIKDWINNTHIPELMLFQTDIQTSIQTQINTALDTIRGEMNTLRTTLEGEMSTLRSNVNSALKGGTKYEDFIIEPKSQDFQLTQSSNAPIELTYTKQGYYPLAIVSVKSSAWYDVDTFTPAYFDVQQEGKAVVKMLVAHGNTAATINGTITIKILWIKVKP